MAVLAADLVVQLQDRSSGFDIHVVDDGRTERLVAAMHDARLRIYRIRHPEEPDEAAANWVGGPSVGDGVIRLLVDLKDGAALVPLVVEAVVGALDAVQLHDAVVGTSAPPQRAPAVPRSTRGCPVLDAVAEALEGLCRGDPDAIQPPEMSVGADAAASRRRLLALLDLAIGQWSAEDLRSVGLGDLATDLRALPPLAVDAGVAPSRHLAAVGNALVATRELQGRLPTRMVVHLERHYALCRNFWDPIVRVAARGHTSTCVQFVGAHPGPPGEHLWSWAATNLVDEALDDVGFAVERAGGDNSWYERASEERWSLAGEVAAAVLHGGEPGPAIAEIAGLDVDAAPAAVADQDLWREPVACITLAALADGGYWIGERTSQAIAVGAASGGAERVEHAVRDHLRGHARQAADFMVASRRP